MGIGGGARRPLDGSPQYMTESKASSSPQSIDDPFVSRPDNSVSSYGRVGPVGGSGGSERGRTDDFIAIDQRLNPVMLGERRLSEGSLADDRDYSRKILRVANPDD